MSLHILFFFFGVGGTMRGVLTNLLLPKMECFTSVSMFQVKACRWTRAYHLKVPPPPMPPQPPRGGPRQRILPTPRGVNMIIWSLDNRFVLAAIMGKCLLFRSSYVYNTSIRGFFLLVPFDNRLFFLEVDLV